MSICVGVFMSVDIGVLLSYTINLRNVFYMNDKNTPIKNKLTKKQLPNWLKYNGFIFLPVVLLLGTQIDDSLTDK